jgi:hypothetical protein
MRSFSGVIFYNADGSRYVPPRKEQPAEAAEDSSDMEMDDVVEALPEIQVELFGF